MRRPEACAGQAAGREGQPVVTPQIAAEAAVWVARLHGPNRSVPMERACLAWQAHCAAHRWAFERCTDTWQNVAGVTLATYASAAHGDAEFGRVRRVGRFTPRGWAWGLAASVLVGVVLLPWHSVDAYDTDVGEQRTVVLQDGTRLSLNTATRVRVDLAKAQRTVNVEHGEALFEVAKDPRRPFVVRVAGTEVVATGTVFAVRSTPTGRGAEDALAVTLVEGQVIVRGGAGRDAGAQLVRPVVMAPGERVCLRRWGRAVIPGEPRTATLVDRPRMDQVLAWRRGEAIFDDVSLLEAVAEMNRYSATPIMATEVAALGGLRISGVFRTGDNASFASAVARVHGLVVRERPDRLELAPK